ncbi:hypothetical protein AWB67_07664 [Caballeronia terrestris]|uniref:Uncharacterized protein n=1 Tax=Caballeronia terrestris TaxID=1226301 RepID=A0A158L632_9BURK|nr:hypothetical protein AWB67_07664 [Caballeronia terrestris]
MTAPHVPTAFSSTPAIDGFSIAASSACGTMPGESSDTAISNSNTIAKP